MFTKYIHNGYKYNLPSCYFTLFVISTLLTIQPVIAQEQVATDQFKIDFLKMFDSSSKKMVALCDSIPFKDYNWQPVKEVRSIKESLIHVANTNYYLASKLNFPIPKGVEPTEFQELVNTKEDVREMLLNSIYHVREAVQKVDNEQLHSIVDFWSGKETIQRIILQVGEHMAEHLGQLIVYARMRGVTPPWSK